MEDFSIWEGELGLALVKFGRMILVLIEATLASANKQCIEYLVLFPWPSNHFFFFLQECVPDFRDFSRMCRVKILPDQRNSIGSLLFYIVSDGSSREGGTMFST